ncbi:MAG TPA: carboxypeptidase-like regulatory domain-containing protein [Candidatus Sulfotelmatobacter sp.]
MDAKGGVLPNAAITIKNESTGLVRTTKADAQGHFSESGLPAGRYTIEASAPGFNATRRTGVSLAADQPQGPPHPVERWQCLPAGHCGRQCSRLYRRCTRSDGRLPRSHLCAHVHLSDVYPELHLTRSRFRRGGRDGSRYLYHERERRRPRTVQHLLPRLSRWQLRHRLRRHSVL